MSPIRHVQIPPEAFDGVAETGLLEDIAWLLVNLFATAVGVLDVPS